MKEKQLREQFEEKLLPSRCSMKYLLLIRSLEARTREGAADGTPLLHFWTAHIVEDLQKKGICTWIEGGRLWGAYPPSSRSDC